MIHDSPSPRVRSSIDPDLLLAQSSWVEALARTLVRDPFRAEDVFQETMLAALEAPPRDAGDVKRLRAWLGRVAFNLAHLSLRRRYRREAREEFAARDDVAHSTADQVARSSVLDCVVATVQELEEPYRSTVLKRYFEGKSTAQIAEETNTTDNAVRKRLWRARAKLRGSLDRVHNGDRLAWFGALAPLAGIELPPLGGASATTLSTSAGSSAGGGAGVFTGLKAVAASPLLWVGALVGAVVLTAVAESPIVVAAHPEAASAADLRPARDLVADAGIGGRFALGGEGLADAGANQPPPPDGEGKGTAQVVGVDGESSLHSTGSVALVHGLVVDLEGAPLGGVCITSLEDPLAVLGWSSTDGTFQAVVPAAAPDWGVSLVAEASGFATVRTSLVERANAESTHVIVVAPVVSVAGRVVDEAGNPLPGTRLEVTATTAAFLDVEAPLTRTTHVPRETIADAEGWYAFEEAITGRGVFLQAWHQGFESLLQEMPDANDLDLTLTLRRPTGPATMLQGIVYLENKEPAPGAVVRLGQYQAISDEHGNFTMQVREIRRGTSLWATKPGFLPAELPGIGTMLAQDQPGHLRVGIELQLGGETLALSGHVVDAEGEPLPDWRVHTLAVETDGDANDGAPVLGDLATTEADGSFVVPGLADEDYYLQAFDPETLLTVRAGPFAAGASDVRLQVPEDAWKEDFEGRVVNEEGDPMAGATLTVSLLVQTGAGSWREFGVSTMSDANGNFAYAQVPRQWVEYQVSHPDGQTGYHGGSEENGGHGDDDGGSDFGLQTTCYLRLETIVGDLAPDTFAVLDAAGHEIHMTALGLETMHGQIIGGHTLVHEVGRNAATLVVYRGNEEAGRTELHLLPGEVVTIHPHLDDSRTGEDQADGSDTDGGSFGNPH